MDNVAELLATHPADVVECWRGLVQGTIVPEHVPPLELVDHIPRFLDELQAALRSTAPKARSVVNVAAEGHGENRLRLGFSLESVVREYGALRRAIVEVARATGTPLPQKDADIVFDAIINGIAHAVSEYSNQRDAEVSRQHNEHIAFLAHELRNPLGTALMGLELLETARIIPAEHRTAAAMIRALTQMRELIDHTLNMSRLASGAELQRQAVSITALVESIVDMVEAEATDRGVAIEHHLEAAVAEPVPADPRLLRSAIGNLVRNAVKFTPARGRVEIRGRVVDNYVRIEVEDTCGGLPPGMVEKMFAPFVRLQADRAGFGLGLAIAKQAVDAHAGNLRVQNLPGKGCIFVVELPTQL